MDEAWERRLREHPVDAELPSLGSPFPKGGVVQQPCWDSLEHALGEVSDWQPGDLIAVREEGGVRWWRVPEPGRGVAPTPYAFDAD